MELEEDYKKFGGSGSGTQHGYTVEARSMKGPTEVSGIVLSERWQEVSFRRGSPGVPAPGGYDSSGQMGRHGLYSYASAQALRWWLHAAADDQEWSGSGSGLERLVSQLKWASRYGIETRLVRHEVKYQYSITALSAHEIVKDILEPPKEAAATAEPPAS